MTAVSCEELRLLRSCTANLETKLDCDLAIRGDGEALERCAQILRRARPSGAAALGSVRRR